MRILIAMSLLFACVAGGCFWVAVTHAYADAGFVVNLLAEIAGGISLAISAALGLIAAVVAHRRRRPSWAE
jgi:hypothetical protein